MDQKSRVLDFFNKYEPKSVSMDSQTMTMFSWTYVQWAKLKKTGKHYHGLMINNLRLYSIQHDELWLQNASLSDRDYHQPLLMLCFCIPNEFHAKLIRIEIVFRSCALIYNIHTHTHIDMYIYMLYTHTWMHTSTSPHLIFRSPLSLWHKCRVSIWWNPATRCLYEKIYIYIHIWTHI